MHGKAVTAVMAVLVLASLLCSALTLYVRARQPPVQSPSERTATGTGVLQAIDHARGAVRIKHQEISVFGMPHMTMTFSVADPRLLAGRQPGEAVEFTLHRQDGTMVLIDLRRYSPRPS